MIQLVKSGLGLDVLRNSFRPAVTPSIVLEDVDARTDTLEMHRIDVCHSTIVLSNENKVFDYTRLYSQSASRFEIIKISTFH